MGEFVLSSSLELNWWGTAAVTGTKAPEEVTGADKVAGADMLKMRGGCVMEEKKKLGGSGEERIIYGRKPVVVGDV